MGKVWTAPEATSSLCMTSGWVVDKGNGVDKGGGWVMGVDKGVMGVDKGGEWVMGLGIH